MDINTHVVEQVTVIGLSGRFTAATTPQVIDLLQQTAGSGSAQVVVDLGEVSFIDSSGLSVLVLGMKRCREHGGDLRLCRLQAPVRMIFELTRLHQAFEILGDEDAAVRAFART
jgi:anti-sigma B factor antagonist